MVADTSVVCDVLHGIQQQVGRTGRNVQFTGRQGDRGRGQNLFSVTGRKLFCGRPGGFIYFLLL